MLFINATHLAFIPWEKETNKVFPEYMAVTPNGVFHNCANGNHENWLKWYDIPCVVIQEVENGPATVTYERDGKFYEVIVDTLPNLDKPEHAHFKK